MSDDRVTKEAVSNYLRKYLYAAQIETTERLINHNGSGLKFSIRSSEGKFDLRIMDEAVESMDADEITAMLESCGTIQVMRDLAEFPVTVTFNGCIF